MPVRAALNVCYALMVKDMDSGERRRFDDELYGFTADNERRTRALWAADDARPDPDSGGES